MQQVKLKSGSKFLDMKNKPTEAHRHTKHLIEIDLHDAKRSIEDICIMGAINKDAKGEEILASLNIYLQGIWAKVLEEHSKQLKYDKLKSDNEVLLNALKGLYEFNLGKPDYLDTLLNNAESAILKAESK